MRVAWFFAYAFFGMIGLPAAIVFAVEQQTGALQWPPEPRLIYDPAWTVKDGQFADAQRLLGGSGPIADLRSVLPAADASVASADSSGTIVVAARLKRSRDMHASIDALVGQYQVTRRSPERGGEKVSTATGMSGLLLRDATRILLVLGTSQDAAEARLARTAGLAVRLNPAGTKRPSGTVFFLVISGLVAWVIAQFFIFPRLASWAGSVPAAAGAAAMPASEIERRLLALNDRKLPFAVRRGNRPGEFVVDWRYGEAKWFDLMRIAGLSRLFRVVLRLDENSRSVRARDFTADVDWSAGRGGADFAFKGSLGINFFLYRREAVLGLQIRGGQITFNPFYQYRFDVRELRDPLVATITTAGWQYKPVLTFFRPIGG